MNKGWFYVVLTCFLELVWVLAFNFASSFWHWLILVPIICLDFYFLLKACEILPTGTVYATFAAVGTGGTALLDTVVFGVEFSWRKGFFLALLLLGVVSLKLAEEAQEKGAV